MNLNKAQIIGNLTRDPEVRKTPTGQDVASFGVATSMKWKGSDGQPKESVEFHNIVAWGKLADICGRFLKKGRKVYVEGRLQTRVWDGKDGTKKSRTEIICENMIILDRAPAGGGEETQGPSKETGEQPAPAAAPEEEIKVEDIPF